MVVDYLLQTLAQSVQNSNYFSFSNNNFKLKSHNILNQYLTAWFIWVIWRKYYSAAVPVLGNRAVSGIFWQCTEIHNCARKLVTRLERERGKNYGDKIRSMRGVTVNQTREPFFMRATNIAKNSKVPNRGKNFRFTVEKFIGMVKLAKAII